FRSLKIYGYFVSLSLILLGMSLIAFSLSKPQFGIKKEKIITEGIDIMIALDVSGSMTTSDFFSYSRIEGAKNILQKFVAKRKGDRIGLVTFAESSFLKCPATVNFDLLTKVIGKIFIDPNKQSSTSIGIGLASAINRLLQMKDNANPDSKIAILVTDGINNSGEISPEAATEIALQTGIKVYTVGIGESNEVDVKLLGDIANRTKGKFFHAKNAGELGPIFDEIDKIEKRKIETLEFVRYKDVGYKYALAGIIIMISGLLFNGLFFKRLG
ncbi:MAG TPA: VWA domain-containing protein, partial [Spirochaetota bacterium]|nr:VWA domain-containing protein [Spirochaetota bacterium]